MMGHNIRFKQEIRKISPNLYYQALEMKTAEFANNTDTDEPGQYETSFWSYTVCPLVLNAYYEKACMDKTFLEILHKQILLSAILVL